MPTPKGSHLSEETKAKMSAVRKGKAHSKENSEIIGKALKGRVITPEWREKLRKAALGRKASVETKKKMSESHSGEKNGFHGKKHSDETKKVIGEIMSKSMIETGRAAGENNPMWGRMGELNPAWKGGTSFFPYCYKFNKKRKKAVRKFFGNRCICCEKHASENMRNNRPEELSVHHIDHDREQGCSGKPFNLVPMCVTCHNKEQHKEEEYRKCINGLLESGFAWGIWSREDYEKEVMYSEK
jgi:hypothetical protein